MLMWNQHLTSCCYQRNSLPNLYQSPANAFKWLFIAYCRPVACCCVHLLCNHARFPDSIWQGLYVTSVNCHLSGILISVTDHIQQRVGSTSIEYSRAKYLLLVLKVITWKINVQITLCISPHRNFKKCEMISINKSRLSFVLLFYIRLKYSKIFVYLEQLIRNQFMLTTALSRSFQVERIRTLLNHIRRFVNDFMHVVLISTGSCRPKMGPMLVPWTLLSGYILNSFIGVSWIDCGNLRCYGDVCHENAMSVIVYIRFIVIKRKSCPAVSVKYLQNVVYLCLV